jgi:recombination protein RecT
MYSKACDSNFSPWKTAYEEMSKKCVIKRALKYAPIKTEFQRALSSDEHQKADFRRYVPGRE